jgi:hypothetical protein
MSFRLTISPLLRAGLTASVALTCAFSPFAAVRAAAQTTYYIATNGNDGNAGTQAAPWASITHAAAVTAAGDTVLVEDGTYNIVSGGFRGDWAIASNGASGSPITYKSQNKWGAHLVGQGTGDGSTVIGVSGAHNIVQDFDITGTDANGIVLASTGTTASYNQAIGNYLHDFKTPCDSNGGSALNSGGGSNYTGVSHDDFIGNILVNIQETDGCTLTAHSSGIYEAIPYGTVANNIVINVNGPGIQSWHDAFNETFFGNTVISGYTGITVGDGDAPGGITNDNSLVQNNIVINSIGCAICEDGATGIHNRYIDNDVHNNGVDFELHNGLTASGTVSADPLFVNNNRLVTGDYHLQSTSPARGTGLALAGILTDYAGIARPQSGATDIGALRYVSTAVTAGLTANPTSIAAGNSSTLTWSSTNAVSATLNGSAVAVNGSQSLTPSSTTTYTFVATAADKSTATSTATVTVVPAPTASISASPTSISSGGSSTLTWSSTNAVSATLNGAAVAVNGSQSVSPTTTTTYTVVATGSTGKTGLSSATVTVTGTPTGTVAAGVSASPTSIVKGQSSVITWTTKNAVSATLNGTPVSLNGSRAVKPHRTTTYKVVATGSNGTTDSGSATVTVH